MKNNYKDKVGSFFSWENFKRGSGWLFLLFGVGLYLIGFLVFEPEDSWGKLSLRIGDLLILGVLLGYLTNSARFMGAFKKDLENIIYGKEFVSQRKDIYPIWERVSQALFGNRFPTINVELLETLKRYFPEKDAYYLCDYAVQINLGWQNKKDGILLARENVSFKLVSETKDQVFYRCQTWTQSNDKKAYECSIKGFTVDDAPCHNGNIQKESSEDGDTIEEVWNVKLEGKNIYRISFEREKKYKFDDDFFIGFRATHIVKDLRVRLTYPKDMDAIFTCRGTLNDFKDDVSKEGNTIAKIYEGIILPRQGYLIPLKPKKNVQVRTKK